MAAINPVGWFEISVQDMARARAFYETVFQARLYRIDTGEGEMWGFAQASDRMGAAGALVQRPRPTADGGTRVYFSCEDCAHEAARVIAAGGTLLHGKEAIGHYGFIVLARDTEGNLIGLHSRQ